MALFGESKALALARALLLERVRKDPVAREGGFSPDMVKRLSSDQVAGTIEATIASIMESVASLTVRGTSPEDALRRVEAHRRSLGRSDDFNPDAGAAEYIRYRVGIEYQGTPLPPDHLNFCINAADHLFRYIDDKGDIKHALLYAQNENAQNRLEFLLDHLVVAFRDDDEESYEHLQKAAQSWAEFRSEQAQKRASILLRAKLRGM